MKEIICREGYLRGRRDFEVMVDEATVNFINGLALVKATKKIQYYHPIKTEEIECYGLINESFEEAFGDDYKDRAGRYLMFLGMNFDAKRVGANDFIISVHVSDNDRNWDEYKHVRLVDGKPVVLNVFQNICQINSNHLIIAERRVYDVLQARFTTKEYSSIEALPTVEGICPQILVSDQVDSYEYENADRKWAPTNGKTGIEDRLFFTINFGGQITSPIYSRLSKDWYTTSIPTSSYDDICAKRREELKEMEERSKAIMKVLRGNTSENK